VEWLHFPPREGKWAWGFSSACRARLRLLWQAGYLDRLWPDRFNGPAVYTLGRRGIEALAAYRGLSPDVRAGSGQGLPGSAFLEHALGIARAYAAIRAALREVPEVHLADFQGEHTFKGADNHDVLPDIADGRRRIPVVPDGLLVLERSDGRRRLVFLEVDRATIPLGRIGARVRGYEGYRIGVGPSLFRARFGLPPAFTVAFVVPTPGRLRSLQKTVSRELRRWGWEGRAGAYLFHLLRDLTPTTALVWEDAAGKETSLLGEVKKPPPPTVKEEAGRQGSEERAAVAEKTGERER
ncbi:MAG TPA: hypothetical protein G4O00_09525, partial [Thermoflexia bacterium]|nr:hypothetical protein [Thermoflexia bacterium]